MGLLAQRVREAIERCPAGLNAFLTKSAVSRSALFAILRGESNGSGRTLARLARAGVNLDGVFAPKKHGKSEAA